MTGICDEGCIEGWMGTQCDSECSVGYFGVECRNKCSKNCIETHKCDRFSGECDNGCRPGWKGGTCNDHCDETFFGINCSQNCGSNCVNFSCHHQTGNCKVYFQHLEKTDPSSLPTIIGGSSGAIIIFLLIVGIVIFSKRTGCFSGGKRKEERSNGKNSIFKTRWPFQTYIRMLIFASKTTRMR